jgi:hypothetical protein
MLMDSVLKKDLEWLLPTLSGDERKDPKKVQAALEDRLPERKGAYILSEIEAALKKEG